MIRRIAFVFALVIGALSLARAEEAAGPAKTWGAKCASCHAKDGKGNPAMAKVFKVEPVKLDMTAKETLAKSDTDLEKIVAEGLNKMPAYKDKLSADDIKAVVGYMRSLAEKK